MRRPVLSLAVAVDAARALAAAGARSERRRERRAHAAGPLRRQAGLRRPRARVPARDADPVRRSSTDASIRRSQPRRSAAFGALGVEPRFGRSRETVASSPDRDRGCCRIAVRRRSSDSARSRRCAICAATCPAALRGHRCRGARRRRHRRERRLLRLVDADWLPIVFAFVLGLSFILLTVAFRSIVVAAQAIVLNLLSVGAAYGLLVLVFQKASAPSLRLPAGRRHRGVGAALPLLRPLRALDGLPRLPAEPDPGALRRTPATRATRSCTASARPRGIITGAALIIVAVFAGFAVGDLVMFQQMGFGVAVALSRRDGDPLRPRARRDEAPRPLELVPAALARVAPARRGRGRGAGLSCRVVAADDRQRAVLARDRHRRRLCVTNAGDIAASPARLAARRASAPSGSTPGTRGPPRPQAPSIRRSNPNYCDVCETFVRTHPGGAEVEISMLFADVRGSTTSVQQMRPTEFSRLMNRFLDCANCVVVDSDGLVDKLVGDEVVALYVPAVGPGSTHGRRSRPRATCCARRPFRAGRGRRPHRRRVCWLRRLRLDRHRLHGAWRRGDRHGEAGVARGRG